MPDYNKLYHLLFNAITDTLDKIEAGDFETARFFLIRAQQQAEELYLSAAESAHQGFLEEKIIDNGE